MSRQPTDNHAAGAADARAADTRAADGTPTDAKRPDAMPTAETAQLEPYPELADGKRQLHLTGFMGSGKSTVGRLLARRLVWNFLDLDAVIERHAGKSIPEIFAEDGETAFREAERHVLRQVVQKPCTVVALGGGTLLDASNRFVCTEVAIVVWLDCSLETIVERCGDSPTVKPGDWPQQERPLWGSAVELGKRFEERLPGYRTAGIAVDASRAPEQVATAVLKELGVRR